VRFRLNVPPGTDARLTAIFANPQIGEIFVLLGEVPDPNQFNLHAIGFVNPNPAFLLPGSPAPYLILMRGTSTAAVPSGTFTLSAAVVGLEIDNVAPNRGSNAGQVTATIAMPGSRPRPSSVCWRTMAPSASPVHRAAERHDLLRNLDLVGLVPGSYDVRAVDGTRSAVASGAFTVTTGSVGQFNAELFAGTHSRVHRRSAGSRLCERGGNGHRAAAHRHCGKCGG
jgi:hypothetical protein